MNIRVCVVDDHTLFRSLMRNLVAGFSGVDPDVKEAVNGKHLLDLLSREPIDVVLLDLMMPVMDGRAAAERLIRWHPACKIIVLSMDDNPSTVPKVSARLAIAQRVHWFKYNCTW